jgi:hypothetical protein
MHLAERPYLCYRRALAGFFLNCTPSIPKKIISKYVPLFFLISPRTFFLEPSTISFTCVVFITCSNRRTTATRAIHQPVPSLTFASFLLVLLNLNICLNSPFFFFFFFYKKELIVLNHLIFHQFPNFIQPNVQKSINFPKFPQPVPRIQHQLWHKSYVPNLG